MQSIFRLLNVPVDFEEIPLSGQNVSPAALENAKASIRRNKLCLKGILYTPPESPSLNVELRKDLDVFASVSAVKTVPGVVSRHSGVDFVIIRENTEGEYSGLEHQPVPGVVESLKVVTRTKSERIIKFAFDFAIRNGRKKITCVHKANIM